MRSRGLPKTISKTRPCTRNLGLAPFYGLGKEITTEAATSLSALEELGCKTFETKSFCLCGCYQSCMFCHCPYSPLRHGAVTWSSQPIYPLHTLRKFCKRKKLAKGFPLTFQRTESTQRISLQAKAQNSKQWAVASCQKTIGVLKQLQPCPSLKSLRSDFAILQQCSSSSVELPLNRNAASHLRPRGCHCLWVGMRQNEHFSPALARLDTCPRDARDAASTGATGLLGRLRFT